jgi:hypothetical protein
MLPVEGRFLSPTVYFAATLAFVRGKAREPIIGLEQDGVKMALLFPGPLDLF